jgi:hypothetical protein
MTLTLANLGERLEKQLNCRLFLAAWLKWRGEQVLPARPDIRAEDLKAAMPATSVWEVEAQDKYIVRLGATVFEEQTGENRRGKNFMDLTPEADRQTRMQRLTPIVKYPCGVFADGCQLRLKDGSTMEFDVLLLPATKVLDGNPNLIYFCNDLTDKTKPIDRSEIVEAPLMQSFAYIDIGCGIPGQ